MSNLIQPLEETLKFNNAVVHVTIKDIKHEDAYRQLNGGFINPIFFQVGHITNLRAYMLTCLGKEQALKNRKITKPAVFDGAFSKDTSYPDYNDVKADWESISEAVIVELKALTDDAILKAAEKQNHPFPENSFRGELSFLTWHESYHIGQMGAVRRYLGYKDIQHSLYDYLMNQSKK